MYQKELFNWKLKDAIARKPQSSNSSEATRVQLTSTQASINEVTFNFPSQL